MSRSRSGIIAEMPSTPPRSATIAICMKAGDSPHRKSAGMVKIPPVASAVDALPIVCARFASRIVARFPRTRKSATVITATGMEVETVIPDYVFQEMPTPPVPDDEKQAIARMSRGISPYDPLFSAAA